MTNSPSQGIPDMLDWIPDVSIGSGSPRKVKFPRARHHSKRRILWVGVKCSARNGSHDPKCTSVKRLCMIREDTGASNEGATCAWRRTRKQLAVRVHFFLCGGLLVEGVMNLVV
ncbi:uncharacterized protein TNCV_4476221 [Trichonephila clavipes]|nr:uncharacterized protein TNCV_4476221 [Trichonephila clavipes]